MDAALASSDEEEVYDQSQYLKSSVFFHVTHDTHTIHTATAACVSLSHSYSSFSHMFLVNGHNTISFKQFGGYYVCIGRYLEE